MKWLRNILKGASLTTALFIFQACYGTPQWLNEVDLSFKVTSSADNSPLKGVAIYTRVSANDYLDWILCGYTDENGLLDTIGTGIADNSDPEFRFQAEGSVYEVKDTVIAEPAGRLIEVKLEKAE